MGQGAFKNVCMIEGNPKWKTAISRQKDLYQRHDEIRNEFIRDYTRILHSTAYRRLKHKTQVFFATDNDHICTRIEHVNHVASISDTIVKYLGLNADLTSAIAIGHDLGHAPFGHHGEHQLAQIISENNLDMNFWHEKNGLWFVDYIETLPGEDGRENNLNLTYAVRDGIVCHCGEVDDSSLHPRDEFLDLPFIEKASQVAPYTWEGCIVKLADKISFLGRDIEDSLRLGILSKQQIDELKKIIGYQESSSTIPNTYIIHELIIDLCSHSNPQDGIRFSNKTLQQLKSLREFNTEFIYKHPRLEFFKNYASLIIKSIFDFLYDLYQGESTYNRLQQHRDTHPILIKYFGEWLVKYSNGEAQLRSEKGYQNEIVYDISNKQKYGEMVISFISGMTDNFAIDVFKELISFK